MTRLSRSLALAALSWIAVQTPVSASYVACGPGRASLFHLSQYGSFYRRPDGSLYYQYFNDVFDKKTVDPRCAGLLGRGGVPLNREPAGF